MNEITTAAPSIASCALCGAEARELYDRAKLTQGIAGTPYRLVRCGDCQLIQMDPLPGSAELDEIYDGSYYGEENVRFVGPVEWVSLLFRRGRLQTRRYFDRPGRVLDVGCGRGEFLKALDAEGWECHGVELNAVAAARARSLFGDRVLVGDFRGVHENASFDLVCFYHVIEHVTHPVEIMDEIARVLKPGGILLLSTPNGASWGFRWFKERAFAMGILQNAFYFRPEHVRSLTDENFDLVSENHFSLEQDPFSYLQCFLNLCDRNDNFLFQSLYRRKPADFGQKRVIWTTLLVMVFALPAFCLSALSSLFRRNYSMNFVLRRK